MSEIDHELNRTDTAHIISKLRQDVHDDSGVTDIIKEIPITNLQPVTPFDRRKPMWTYDDWLEENIDVLEHLYNVSLDIIKDYMCAPLVDEQTDVDSKVDGSTRTFDDFAYFMYSKTNKCMME